MAIRSSVLFMAIVLTMFLVPAFLSAAPAEGLKGWEEDGQYNSLYLVSELDRLKGDVKKIFEVVPMEGMDPGVALILKDGEGEKVTVHLGPKSFLGKNVGLKRGDRVKIRGAWAEINGEDVFMAAKIKKGDYFSLKVRLTKNGKPFWSMSPEELAKERAAE